MWCRRRIDSGLASNGLCCGMARSGRDRRSAGGAAVNDVVVLVGASGSGKSTWAADRYARGEIVSSDALRAAVGTGDADLDASTDAFAVLDVIVAARLRRGLTTVIDTLGLDD